MCSKSIIFFFVIVDNKLIYHSIKTLMHEYMVYILTNMHLAPTLIQSTNGMILLRSDIGSFNLQHMVFHMHSFTRPAWGRSVPTSVLAGLECLHLTSVTNVSLETFRLIMSCKSLAMPSSVPDPLQPRGMPWPTAHRTQQPWQLSSEGQCLSMEGGRCGSVNVECQGEGREWTMQFPFAKCKHADTFSSNIAMNFHWVHTVTACR